MFHIPISRTDPPRPAGADHRRATTVWGVVIAAGVVGATLALNAPGGMNSIAGRGITWMMRKLSSVEAAPPAPLALETPAPAPAPARVEPQPAPSPAPGLEAARPEPPSPEDTAGATRRSAVRARSHMAHAPTGVEFRNVYAGTILGVFNAETPDQPFLGFCGEISVPAGEGWGRPGWKPFFVSETRSTPPGQTPFMDQANPGTLAKCANVEPSRDYSDVFNAGPTDQGLEPWQKHALRTPSPTP